MRFELLTIGYLSRKEWWFEFFKINSFSIFSIGNGYYKFDGGCIHYQIFVFKFCGLGWEKRIRKV